VTLFEKATQSNREQIQIFLDKNTESDIYAREDLQSRARSLLNTQSQIEQALHAARSAQPLVFAVDVSGSETVIEKLGRAKQVRTLARFPDPRSSSTDEARIARLRSIKPELYDAEYRDPRVHGGWRIPSRRE
jgi:hypothetical protein